MLEQQLNTVFLMSAGARNDCYLFSGNDLLHIPILSLKLNNFTFSPGRVGECGIVDGPSEI